MFLKCHRGCARLNDASLPTLVTHVLIFGTWDVILYGKKYFTDVIKLKILRWRDYPGLSSGPNIIVSVPMKQKLEGQSHRKRYDNGSQGWSDVGP